MTIIRDARLGLATGQARSHIVVRFEECLDPGFRDELERLTRTERTEAERIAERLQPIEIVVENHRGRIEIHGYVQPPVRRGRPLHELEFRVRETLT